MTKTTVPVVDEWQKEKLEKLSWRRELFFYYHGIGDDLLFNAVLYHLGRQNREKFIVGSAYPSIYQGNPYVWHLPFKQATNYRLGKVLLGMGLIQAVTHVDYYQEGRVPKKHILRLLSDRVGLKDVPLRPMIFLGEMECSRKFLPPGGKPWIALQSTGNSRWTDNKNWGADRFAELAKLISNKYSLVQLGSAEDPALPVDCNLAGMLSLRETFQVLGECSGFVGQVGFLMHAAAATFTPSVIVYGGFEAPWQSGYPFNTNMYSAVPCAPCWLESTCPYEKKCLTQIQPAQVVVELQKLLEP